VGILKLFINLVCVLFLFQTAFALDLGFRFKDGKCVNDKGEEGLNPDFFGQCSDLSGKTLGKFNFTGIDFSGSNFQNADLRSSILVDTNLVQAKFDGANLSGVNVSDANLKDASLKNAVLTKLIAGSTNFSNCDFKDADMSGADLTYSILTGANLTGVKASKVNFTETDLSGVNFTSGLFREALFSKIKAKGLIFTGGDFTSARIESVDFENVQAAGSIYSFSKIKNSKFISATFVKSNWKSAQVESSDFSNANLSDSILTRASFLNSNLSGANLTKTNIQVSDFTGDDFTATQWTGAVFGKSTKFKYTVDEAVALGMVYIKRLSSSLFYNSTYVNTNDNGEAFNLGKRMSDLGVSDKFSELSSAEIGKVTDQFSLLVFPMLDVADITPAITDELSKLFTDYLTDGGSVLVSTSSIREERMSNFVKKAFGMTWNEVAIASELKLDQAQFANSVFAGFSGKTLGVLDAVFCLNNPPAEMLKLAYDDTGCVALGVLPVGAGEIIYFGYDGYNFVPTGNQDGGWAELFDLGIKAHN
jgi:uncharacterized protein YjbI with pentapeptide repeats